MVRGPPRMSAPQLVRTMVTILVLDNVMGAVIHRPLSFKRQLRPQCYVTIRRGPPEPHPPFGLRALEKSLSQFLGKIFKMDLINERQLVARSGVGAKAEAQGARSKRRD